MIRKMLSLHRKKKTEKSTLVQLCGWRVWISIFEHRVYTHLCKHVGNPFFVLSIKKNRNARLYICCSNDSRKIFILMSIILYIYSYMYIVKYINLHWMMLCIIRTKCNEYTSQTSHKILAQKKVYVLNKIITYNIKMVDIWDRSRFITSKKKKHNVPHVISSILTSKNQKDYRKIYIFIEHLNLCICSAYTPSMYSLKYTIVSKQTFKIDEISNENST